MALKQLTRDAQQGVVMAFADVFFLLTLLFVALAALANPHEEADPGLHGA